MIRDHPNLKTETDAAIDNRFFAFPYLNAAELKCLAAILQSMNKKRIMMIAPALLVLASCGSSDGTGDGS